MVINDYAAAARVQNWQFANLEKAINSMHQTTKTLTMIYQFWLPFILLTALILFFDRRFGTLRDISVANPQPYSWARVQLAWWTVIILSSLIAIVWRDIQVSPPGNLPTLHYSTLILLGISAATITIARSIDMNDVNTQGNVRHQNQPKQGFLTDIISDQDGVSIHRLQTIVFNALFGIWFIGSVTHNLQAYLQAGQDICAIYAAGTQDAANCKLIPLDYIMPVVTDNNLMLLGLSGATYAAMKTTENKLAASAPNTPNAQAVAPNIPNNNLNNAINTPNRNQNNPNPNNNSTTISTTINQAPAGSTTTTII